MELNPEMLEQSPIIVKPDDEDLIAKLRYKQSEYLERIGDQYTHPEQAIVLGLAVGNSRALDAYIKHKLLTQVLEESTVETWTFSQDIITDPVINGLPKTELVEVLKRTAIACGVIEAYCSNDTSQLNGGTGLR